MGFPFSSKFTEFVIRIGFLGTSIVMFMPIFFGAITHDTGKATLYTFVIPILGSLFIITYILKNHRGYWIIPLSMLLLSIGISTEQGSFISYTSSGLAFFTLLFGTLVPKRW